MTTASNGQYHATVWLEFGQLPAVDLHPANSQGLTYIASSVYSVREATVLQQGVKCLCAVGLATVRKGRRTIWHAMVWSGTASSAVDLHGLLGPQFVQSVATGMDEAGGISGAARDKAGLWHDVFWLPQ